MARAFGRELRELCRRGVAEGWTHFKMKVGADIADDSRRAELIREEIGLVRRTSSGRWHRCQ
jgi:L-fuconate dehydratase